MKIRIALITTVIFSLFAFTSCNDDSDPMEDLKSQVTELEKLADRSENIQNEEEAFTLLSDLIDVMKDARNASLALDEPYRDYKRETFKDSIKSSKTFEQEMKEFNEIQSEMEKHLTVISKNLEPYKEKDEVKKMLEKLHEIMITK